MKHKVTDVMVEGTFSKVKCYADYESVMRNAKFAFLFFFVHGCLLQNKTKIPQNITNSEWEKIKTHIL